MIFRYYPETDTLYINLSKKISSESLEVVEDQIFLDFDDENCVVGIQVDYASDILDLKFLEETGVLAKIQTKPSERRVSGEQEAVAD